ncbi:hypothetical protein F5144DRAFT_614166 [Chaetomium tenue]|uniref:Uncharacterized protein n=1 Tax=Chaetomium tenue TaxID=1854479 RepID=A0ACB7P6J6_9PEZI|nr:hypothetical protein F5144DRAFT_614166 [Chaetomium globosum]
MQCRSILAPFLLNVAVASWLLYLICIGYRYLAVIEKQGIHKIKSKEATEFNPTEETWQLISHAVELAQKIYSDMPHSPRDTIPSPSGDSQKDCDIRRAASKRRSCHCCDRTWFKQTMLNHDQSLGPPRAYHRGFLPWQRACKRTL